MSSTVSQEVEQSPLRILIVDDNSLQIEFVKTLLSQDASILTEITEVDSLSAAFSALEKNLYDLVLLDLGLPESSGIETYEKFNQQYPSVPVVVITAEDDDPIGIKAIKMGAQDYLVKGEFSAKTLKRVIRYAVERRGLEKQLQEAQKLDALGRLAGGVAHDFNNLLTVIQGFTDLRVKLLPEGDDTRNDLLEIQKAAEQAAAITRQLLAFSRKQIMRPRVVDVNKVISDLEPMLRSLLGSNYEWNYEAGVKEACVKADPLLIEQVLIDLTANAKEAMAQEGKVVVKSSAAEIKSGEVPDLSEGHYVTLVFRDTGAGMDQETQSKIFEPFFSTKVKTKGVGLGLATTYGTMKQLGGHITVASEPGHGSVFTLYIPLVEEKPVEEKEVAQGKEEAVGGSETILVVEDEELVRELIVRVLSDLGYNVLEAGGGYPALKLVKSESVEKIDLVLTDIMMPRMSGGELAKKLKESFRDIKIVFMSGFTDQEIVEKGVLQEDVTFLQKPFLPEALVAKVRRVLDRG